MSGLDGNTRGGVPTRGGGGNAAACDEEAGLSDAGDDDAPSVSLHSWAGTEASCFRGDLRARDAVRTGEMNLRPVDGATLDYQAFDGDVNDVHDDGGPGISGTFGVLCGNWGGSRD